MQIEQIYRFQMGQFNLGGEIPPSEAVASLRQIDDKFELIWDRDGGRWLIYRLTQKGVTDAQDTLSFQIKAPQTGTMITSGIKDWAKKFDINPMGAKDKSELEMDWRKQFRSLQSKSRKIIQDREDDLQYHYDDVLLHLLRDRTVSAPIVVGYNKKNGTVVRAVPKPQAKVK